LPFLHKRHSLDDDAEIAESEYDGFVTRQTGLYNKIDELQNAGLLDTVKRDIGRVWSDESAGHCMTLGEEVVEVSKIMMLFYKHKVKRSSNGGR
jgi:hypothetical protein